MTTPPTRSGVISTTPPHPSELTQEVRVGSIPPSQTAPAQNGTLNRTRASVYDEYVSAGGYAWYLNYPRSLPWSIDDVTRDFGDDLYERLELDGEIASLVNSFKAALLEDGVHLTSAITDKSDPDFARAAAVCTWCEAALDGMRPRLPVVLWDMADAVLHGNRVAEIVWHLAPDLDGTQALLIRSLKPKPRQSVSFVCDAYFNVLGVLVLMPGMATVVQPDLLITSLDLIPNFVPREKFAILTFRMKNSDPRGRSIARAAYTAWQLKMQGWPEYLKYLAQFASPSVWGTTPENAEPQLVDQFGNPLPNPVSPETAMVQQLVTLRNGTALAFPAGSAVHPIQMLGDGSAFREWVDTMDRQMAKAILGQTLAQEEGRHQTRAASGSHQDVKDSLVRVVKPTVEALITDDLLTPLLRYNRPADLHLLPTVTLGRTEQRDFPTTAAGVAALESSGYLGESQKAGIDAMLGLPPRDLAADAASAKEALAAATSAAANPAQIPGERVIDKAAGGVQASGQRAISAAPSTPTIPVKGAA